jgi:long-chain acyl-CoA synthetase
VLEFFWALGIPVLEGYGMTENSAQATVTPGGDVRLGKVGVAVPECEVRIADDGEILTRGPGTFLGYFRNPEATAEAIDTDGWLHTGDIGELDDDGFLTITDRKKDIIITAGGKNISPSEIENALKVSPYVREAVVVGDRRKYLVALLGIELDTVGSWAQQHRIPFTTYADLSAKPEVVGLVREVVDRVNATLAPVEQIKQFALLPKELDHEDGEVTATQKVKRRAIEDVFGPMVEALYR